MGEIRCISFFITTFAMSDGIILKTSDIYQMQNDKKE